MRTVNEDIFESARIEQIRAARVAGILFIFNLLIPTLGYVFIQSQLFVKNNFVVTSTNIIENQGVFSFGIISELFLAIGLVVLGYSLYVLVRQVNKRVAFFAFIIKCIEATLMAVVTLISFLAFLMLINSNYFQEISFNQIQSVAGFLFNQHETLNSIPMVLLGIEMVLFSVLLVKSRLIPLWISYFGIVSFCSIFIYGILTITVFGANLMLLTVPSFLFELIIGIWLLTRGISYPIPKKV